MRSANTTSVPSHPFGNAVFIEAVKSAGALRGVVEHLNTIISSYPELTKEIGLLGNVVQLPEVGDSLLVRLLQLGQVLLCQVEANQPLGSLCVQVFDQVLQNLDVWFEL